MRARGHRPQRVSIVVDGRTTNQPQDGIIGGCRLGQGSQQEHPAPFAQDKAIGPFIKDIGVGRRGQDAGAAKGDKGGGGDVEIDAANECQVTLAGEQTLAGNVKRHQ